VIYHSQSKSIHYKTETWKSKASVRSHSQSTGIPYLT